MSSAGFERPPSLVVAMRQAIDAAAAGAHGQVVVRHDDEGGPRRHGWASVLQLVDPAGAYVTIWYDGGDRDVMVWGDLPYREWFPEHDEGAARECLRAVGQLVGDLAGGQRAQAVAAVEQRLERARRSASRWWRAPARRRGLVVQGVVACPQCTSRLTSAVVAPGRGTWGAPFRAPVDLDGPAYGCLACGERWGRWGDEFADGR